MYESPIKIIESTIDSFSKAIIKQRDDAIFDEIQSSFGVDVDKAELIRALQYDRNQYDKGYADGKQAAMDELVRCRDCANACDEGRDTYTCRAFPYKGIGGLIPGDGFCHYGERREGE